MSRYVQVGVTALRGPTGEFLPAVPLYIKTDDARKTFTDPAAADLPAPVEEIAPAFAQKFRKYTEGLGAARSREEGLTCT